MPATIRPGPDSISGHTSIASNLELPLGAHLVQVKCDHENIVESQLTHSGTFLLNPRAPIE